MALYPYTKFGTDCIAKSVIRIQQNAISSYFDCGLNTTSAMSSRRPTNDISIEFEIWPQFAVLWFKVYSTDHNEILRTSQ